MRFREYAERPRQTPVYRPPHPRAAAPVSPVEPQPVVAGEPPVTGHDRWMRDDISSGILGGDPGAPRACLFGEIRQDGFRDAFCLVVDDDGKAEYVVERGAGSVEVDRDLGLLARLALDRLIDDPASRLYNGLFRAAVWAATTLPMRTQVSGLLWVATFDATDTTTGAETPGLARLLPADRHLARALATMLGSPVDLAARRAFEDATDRAAAAAGFAAPPRLDLTRTVLTAAGVTAALLGDTDTSRAAAVSQVAVTGTWPGDGDPLRTGPAVQAVRWQGLDWQVMDQPAW